MAASENPAAFAACRSGWSSSGAAATVLAISLMFSSCSTNHGSMPVTSATDSGVGSGAQRLEHGVQPAVVRGAAPLEQLVGVVAWLPR